MLEGKTLGNDVCGVTLSGAMLEHGSCEQSAKEFRLAGLQRCNATSAVIPSSPRSRCL